MSGLGIHSLTGSGIHRAKHKTKDAVDKAIEMKIKEIDRPTKHKTELEGWTEGWESMKNPRKPRVNKGLTDLEKEAKKQARLLKKAEKAAAKAEKEASKADLKEAKEYEKMQDLIKLDVQIPYKLEKEHH